MILSEGMLQNCLVQFCSIPFVVSKIEWEHLFFAGAYCVAADHCAKNI